MVKQDRAGRVSKFIVALIVFNILLVALVAGLLVGGGLLPMPGGAGGAETEQTADIGDTASNGAPVPPAEPEPETGPAQSRRNEAEPAGEADSESQSGTAEGNNAVSEAAQSLITPPPAEGGAEPRPQEPAAADPGQVAMREDGTSSLAGIQPGMTYNAVTQLLGREGTLDNSAADLAFHPVGWYRYRWSDEEGGVVIALFNPDAVLMNIEASGVSGMDALLDQPGFKVPAWLNQNFREAGLPVRAVNASLGQQGGNYPFQSQLSNENGQLVGTVEGVLYVGDGQSTYLPGDQQPYRFAMEGAYQYYLPNGGQNGDSFAVVEY